MEPTVRAQRRGRSLGSAERGPAVVVSEPSPSGKSARGRLWTVPNALSAVRLAAIPVFFWFLVGPHLDLAALGILAYAGVSDWLDGKLARAWNQVSRVGELLDPMADRLYVLATLVAFVLRDIVPWWLVLVLIGRDVVLGVVLLVLRRRGFAPLPVHFLGKAATFNLLYAFPLLLLGEPAVGGHAVASVAQPVGWAFTVWGASLYVWSAGLYVLQAGRILRAEEEVSCAPS